MHHVFGYCLLSFVCICSLHRLHNKPHTCRQYINRGSSISNPLSENILFTCQLVAVLIHLSSYFAGTFCSVSPALKHQLKAWTHSSRAAPWEDSQVFNNVIYIYMFEIRQNQIVFAGCGSSCCRQRVNRCGAGSVVLSVVSERSPTRWVGWETQGGASSQSRLNTPDSAEAPGSMRMFPRHA